MNREILFRGKRLDNGEWVEGYIYEHQPPLTCFSGDPKEDSKWYIVRTAFADWSMPRQVEMLEVDPSTLGQFIGQLDKNGVKIFEGDKVRVTALSNDHHQKGATDVLTTRYFYGAPQLCVDDYEGGAPLFPFCVDHTLEVLVDES